MQYSILNSIYLIYKTEHVSNGKRGTFVSYRVIQIIPLNITATSAFCNWCHCITSIIDIEGEEHLDYYEPEKVPDIKITRNYFKDVLL